MVKYSALLATTKIERDVKVQRLKPSTTDTVYAVCAVRRDIGRLSVAADAYIGHGRLGERGAV